MARLSAGLVMYRFVGGKLQVLLGVILVFVARAGWYLYHYLNYIKRAIHTLVFTRILSAPNLSGLYIKKSRTFTATNIQNTSYRAYGVSWRAGTGSSPSLRIRPWIGSSAFRRENSAPYCVFCYIFIFNDQALRLDW